MIKVQQIYEEFLKTKMISLANAISHSRVEQSCSQTQFGNKIALLTLCK